VLEDIAVHEKITFAKGVAVALYEVMAQRGFARIARAENDELQFIVRLAV